MIFGNVKENGFAEKDYKKMDMSEMYSYIIYLSDKASYYRYHRNTEDAVKFEQESKKVCRLFNKRYF